jgi:hypothetical protein
MQPNCNANCGFLECESCPACLSALFGPIVPGDVDRKQYARHRAVLAALVKATGLPPIDVLEFVRDVAAVETVQV